MVLGACILYSTWKKILYECPPPRKPLVKGERFIRSEGRPEDIKSTLYRIMIILHFYCHIVTVTELLKLYLFMVLQCSIVVETVPNLLNQATV